MKASLATIVLVLALTACSVENGGKILQPTPSGNVQVSLVGGDGSVLQTTKKDPQPVPAGFSLYVNEPWYTDYFTATVVSWTANTPEPCLVVPAKPQNQVMTFSWLSSAGCGPSSGDVEGVRVSDIFGHQTLQYFTETSSGSSLFGGAARVKTLHRHEAIRL
jgi:hypothetical protein